MASRDEKFLAGIEVLIEARRNGLIPQAELSPQDLERLDDLWASYEKGEFEEAGSIEELFGLANDSEPGSTSEG